VPTWKSFRDPQARLQDPTDPGTAESICLMIESAGAGQRPAARFLRPRDWQRIRFEHMRVGPMTAFGTGRRGSAHSHPRNGGESRAFDPFNPVQCLPGVRFLASCATIGPLGLAAAAYMPGRAAFTEWLRRNPAHAYEPAICLVHQPGTPSGLARGREVRALMPESAPPTTCRI